MFAAATIQFFRSDTISISSAFNYIHPSEVHASMPHSSWSNDVPSVISLQWPDGNAETDNTVSGQIASLDLADYDILTHYEQLSLLQSSSVEPSNAPAPAVSTIPLRNNSQTSFLPESSPKPVASSALTAPSNSSLKSVQATADSSTAAHQLASSEISQPNLASVLPLARNNSLCDYCGCSQNGQISRIFNQPDRLGPVFLDSSRLEPFRQLAPSPRTKMSGQIWVCNSLIHSASAGVLTCN